MHAHVFENGITIMSAIHTVAVSDDEADQVAFQTATPDPIWHRLPLATLVDSSQGNYFVDLQ